MADGCRAAGSLEACGLMIGAREPDGWRVHAATRAANVAADPARSFEIDPGHLLQQHRAARADAPAMVGVWHSHPGGLLVPSAADLAGATEDGWLWLILDGRGARAAGFVRCRQAGSGFLPVAVRRSASVDTADHGC